MTQRKQAQAVATIEPRLPFPAAQILKNFELSQGDWLALVDAIFPTAKSTESVILALSYCRKRGLDPFKRVIHIVAIWDEQKKRMIDTIWPGIGELRTTAHRTGKFAGKDKVEYGPDVTEEFQPLDKNGRPSGQSFSVTYPEWAQVTVYRTIGQRPLAFAGPEVYWKETFFRTKAKVPNSMWRQRPRGQLAKCAEAAALRAAFPEEIGDWQTDDEVGVAQRVDDWQPETASDAPERPTRDPGGKATESAAARSGDPQEGRRDTKIAGEVIEATNSHGDVAMFTLPAEREDAARFLDGWGQLAAHDGVLGEFLDANTDLVEAVGADRDELAAEWMGKANAATSNDRDPPATTNDRTSDGAGISQDNFDQLVYEAKEAHRTKTLDEFLKTKRVDNKVKVLMNSQQFDDWKREIEQLKGN